MIFVMTWACLLYTSFELNNVKQGVFGLATRLYGITFKKNPDIPVYHKDVDAYEVFDKDGKFLAVFYTDFHPRAGKRSGAWMTSYKEQWIDEKTGENSRPHISIVMNFTKPTQEMCIRDRKNDARLPDLMVERCLVAVGILHFPVAQAPDENLSLIHI